ncbi:hypothetical protein ACFPRL_10435 [Pseudoclavibacter helvolus]
MQACELLEPASEYAGAVRELVAAGREVEGLLERRDDDVDLVLFRDIHEVCDELIGVESRRIRHDVPCKIPRVVADRSLVRVACEHRVPSAAELADDVKRKRVPGTGDKYSHEEILSRGKAGSRQPSEVDVASSTRTFMRKLPAKLPASGLLGGLPARRSREMSAAGAVLKPWKLRGGLR